MVFCLLCLFVAVIDVAVFILMAVATAGSRHGDSLAGMAGLVCSFVAFLLTGIALGGALIARPYLAGRYRVAANVAIGVYLSLLGLNVVAVIVLVVFA